MGLGPLPAADLIRPGYSQEKLDNEMDGYEIAWGELAPPEGYMAPLRRRI